LVSSKLSKLEKIERCRYWSRQRSIALGLIVLNLVIWTKVVLANDSLPPLKIYPLPDALARWSNSDRVGDYFDSVRPHPEMNYLIWGEFPVKIYVDKPSQPPNNSASDKRFRRWVEIVREGIEQWKIYLPLIEVDKPELADIEIWRQSPPLIPRVDPQTGKRQGTRAANAETTYKFYLRDRTIAHRMTIKIQPGQAEFLLLGTVRHEIGHALGIWGHSPVNTDALYFSSTANPGPISARDINTLKKIYQQPTRLGQTFSD
jgi:predicted Zn-dependent protease